MGQFRAWEFAFEEKFDESGFTHRVLSHEHHHGFGLVKIQ